MRFIPQKSVTLFAILTGALGAYARISPPESSCSSTISWEACPGATQFECASYQVPLDYANLKVGNATLPLIRLKATKHPRLGAIFTNPGGPGMSGVGYLISTSGAIFSTITNHQYDIISWDPRGVNNSIPLISCGFTSQDSLGEFLGDTIPGIGFEARGNFTYQDDLDSFFSKVNETDAKLVETGQRCLETDGAFLKYMGSTAVVRDMVGLADCIEGPTKPINYWGISYGTVVGNYFVNMFPKRVGRVVIDGIVDTVGWATEPTYKMADVDLAGTEAAFSGFSEACAQAGPQNCSLAQNGSTAVSISQGVRQLIDTVYDLHKAGRLDVTSFEIRSFLQSQMDLPITWDTVLVPQLVSWAAKAENATSGASSSIINATQAHPDALSSRQSTVDPGVQLLLSNLVITCVDSIDQKNVTTEQVFEEVVRVTQNEAPLMGEFVLTTGPLFCHRFPVRAVERFTGPFNHTLANPIMVIGNRADPITPFESAQKIAGLLGNSARLLEQDGIGHMSIAENSDCTQDLIRNYFLHGVLPKKGQVCATDQALFPTNRTLVSPDA